MSEVTERHAESEGRNLVRILEEENSIRERECVPV
jgi:hypothetical protein